MTILKNRWSIAWIGTLMQACLGSVYAWSYFQLPLMRDYQWNNTQVSWVFSLAICFLGLGAAWGGMNLSKFGPRRLAMTGGILFGSGLILAALSLKSRSLAGLYVSYGVIGGTGLGLGYVTPVATVAKWFPDRKGLATGMVIMGFGLGALLMSKVLAPLLMTITGGNMPGVFALLGVIFLVMVTGCGSLLENPPAGYGVHPAGPDGGTPSPAALKDIAAVIRSRQFLLMWGVFFCNIVAGIAIIGFQSPLLQDRLHLWDPTLAPAVLASAGATLIAVSSLFNGVGRFFWGGLSDRVGRIRTFRIMLATQILAFLALSKVGNPWLFSILICYVLACYGGGFGTIPAFVLDIFGGRLMPVVYGCLLTAWSMGGIAGPQIVAWLKDHHPQQAGQFSFLAGAVLLGAGLALSWGLSSQTFAPRQRDANPGA